MNTNILRPIFYVLFLFIFVSCEKEKADPDSIVQGDADIKINALVEKANDRYLGGGVQGGEDASFRVENEGLIDEYTANHDGFIETRPQGNAFLGCLRSVEPDREQRALLGRALKAYSERNERIIRAHRDNLLKLRERIENARQQLRRRVEAGEIDREQYHNRILELRKAYQEAISRIKASHAVSFSRSYNLLLNHIMKVLNINQWDTLTNCIDGE